jgi:hypothetical protein
MSGTRVRSSVVLLALVACAVSKKEQGPTATLAFLAFLAKWFV